MPDLQGSLAHESPGQSAAWGWDCSCPQWCKSEITQRVPSSNQSISLARPVSLRCVYVGVWQNVAFRAKFDIYHTALTRSWLSSAPLVGHPLHLVFSGQHSATLFQEWE